MLDSAVRSRVFLITGEKNILIDTGMPGGAAALLSEIESLGTDPGSVSDILLTHHDVDHTGSVRKIQEATGAEVWIGTEDEPYLMHRKKRPGVKRIIQTFVRAEAPDSCRTFGSSGYSGEIRVIAAPGHTPGHHIFQYGPVLFSGDLFKTPEGGFQEMRPAMNWSQEKLQSSIGMLRGLSFDWLCPSHGVPVRNDERLQTFLQKICSV